MHLSNLTLVIEYLKTHRIRFVLVELFKELEKGLSKLGLNFLISIEAWPSIAYMPNFVSAPQLIFLHFFFISI